MRPPIGAGSSLPIKYAKIKIRGIRGLETIIREWNSRRLENQPIYEMMISRCTIANTTHMQARLNSDDWEFYILL